MALFNKPTLIYGLIDPRTQELRYVGKTVKPVADRCRAHINLAKSGNKTHRCNWIRGVLADGLKPIMVIIETVPVDGDWAEAESFWIEYYRFIGCDLTNLTAGGEGVPGIVRTDQYRDAIAAAHRSLPGKTESGFRGVVPGIERWRSFVQVSGKLYYLGSYPATEEGRTSAARACDRFELFMRCGDASSARLLDEFDANGAWAESRRDLPIPSVVKLLRRDAKSMAPLAVTNKSGFRGVMRDKKSGKWAARATISGKVHHVGLYEATVEGRAAAAKSLDALEMQILGSGNFTPRIVAANDNEVGRVISA